jgi:hypothetical protein
MEERTVEIERLVREYSAATGLHLFDAFRMPTES